MTFKDKWKAFVGLFKDPYTGRFFFQPPRQKDFVDWEDDAPDEEDVQIYVMAWLLFICFWAAYLVIIAGAITVIFRVFAA